MKKINLILIAVFIIAVGIFYMIATDSDDNLNNCEAIPADELNLKEHKNLAMHIHPQLKISVFKERIEIPAHIGLLFNENIMRPIHTHDNSGYLHVEAPCLRDFTLNDFFVIWNKNFNKSCLVLDSEYCINGTSSLRLYVNGEESFEFENLILKDKQEIEIRYE